MKLFATLVAFLVAVPLQAQTVSKVPLQVFVDTAGVAPVDGKVQQYETWIYARANEQAPPASGVLVEFDCVAKVARRKAHIVFHPTQVDSEWVVTGSIEADDSTSQYGRWQPLHNQSILDLVCSVGQQHEAVWNGAGKGGPIPQIEKPKNPFLKET